MSITTKRGDAGQTDLLGARVGKDHSLVELVGVLDELNAQLGVAAPLIVDEMLSGIVKVIQEQLFVLGAEAAAAEAPKNERLLTLTDAEQHLLDGFCQTLESTLPPLTHFVLPGGSPSGAALHLARAVARRAERRLVIAAATHASLTHAVPYLNRLSDLLFLMARTVNRIDEAEEVIWKSRPTS